MGFFDFLLSDEERMKRKVQSHILRCTNEFYALIRNNDMQGITDWLDELIESIDYLRGARALHLGEVATMKTSRYDIEPDSIFSFWRNFEDGEALLHAKILTYNGAIGELLVEDTFPLPSLWSEEMSEYIDGRREYAKQRRV